MFLSESKLYFVQVEYDWIVVVFLGGRLQDMDHWAGSSRLQAPERPSAQAMVQVWSRTPMAILNLALTKFWTT